jgi:MFS family permease
MSITQTQSQTIELAETSRERDFFTSGSTADDTHINDDDIPASAVEAIPDGGYGWNVVLACSVVTFMINGWSGSWGVLQTALIQSFPTQGSTTSSLSFVGSLNIAVCVALGLAAIRFSQLIGARYSMLLGVLMMGFGSILSSFTVNNLGGLFATAGITFGLGTSLTYAMSTILPVQWFNSKLGTANGLVKLGGGLGATTMAVVLQILIDKVGIPWTFRIIGCFTLATGVPAALLVRERASASRAQFVDFSLFKSIPFCCIFAAGAIGTFALFVPAFFLPLFANSIGLSSSTGAGIVAGYNACTALGRLGAGIACDRFGSINMLFLTMALNAISMLAIWPVSGSLGLLVVFATLNGIANGAFFVTMPTAVGRLIGPGQAAVGMGMATTGWTAGYLMGSPIAGILISATGAGSAHSIVPYRAAIFYAGGVALASAAFVLTARLRLDTKLIKKI